MWQLKDIEIESVIGLAGEERYSYLIKKSADQEIVWSLAQDHGWALATDSIGNEAVPIWPHEKYAALCASGAWQGFEPKQIALEVWRSRWVPGMVRDQRLVAVFPTTNDKGVFVSPERLEIDLRAELENYE